MESAITREQFASAVASAISSIHHLYREVGRLMSGLRERLAEEPDSFSPLAGTLAKSEKDPTRLVVRNEYGALFTPTLIDDEEDEEEFEEGDESEETDTVEKPIKRAPVEIAANSPLLVVRTVMYDPKKLESLEPQIQYAILSEWTVGNTWVSEHRFLLRKSMLRKVPKALGAGLNLSNGARLMTEAKIKSIVGAKKVDGRQLSCRLPAGVGTVALYELDTADALDELVGRMKAMWKQAQS